LVEIMTCPGGCIGGGRTATAHQRTSAAGVGISAIYKEDEGKKLRKSHDNPKIKQIYGEFLLRRWARNRTTAAHQLYEAERV